MLAQMLKAAGQRQHWKEAIVLFDRMQAEVRVDLRCLLGGGDEAGAGGDRLLLLLLMYYAFFLLFCQRARVLSVQCQLSCARKSRCGARVIACIYTADRVRVLDKFHPLSLTHGIGWLLRQQRMGVFCCRGAVLLQFGHVTWC